MTEQQGSAATQNITLQDIADHCGVSKSTVRWAMRGDTQHLSDATRRRILDAAQALGYDPSLQQAARRLAMQKYGQDSLGHIVALFFPPSNNVNYFDMLFHGILAELQRERFGLLLCATMLDETGVPSPLPLSFDHGDVDGAIMYATTGHAPITREQLRGCKQFGARPVIALFNPHPGCLSVLADDWHGGYASCMHLLTRGHRHVGHFYDDTQGCYPYLQRLDGMRAACREFGLDPQAHLCYLDYHTVASAPHRLPELLQANPQVTAICARYDLMAIALYHELRRAGFSVPGDYSLIGYDDTDAIFDQIGNNILTTVQVPLAEAGTQAACMLLRHVADKTLPDETITLPTSLIERMSTAAPRGA